MYYNKKITLLTSNTHVNIKFQKKTVPFAFLNNSEKN